MTYVITSQCIGCSRCQASCPTGAITHNGHYYQIDSERCDDCVGHYSVPQCWAVCPTNAGCIPGGAIAAQSRSSSLSPSSDYWERWFEVYNQLISRLNTSPSTDYWHQWFDRYAQALSKQLQSSQLVEVTP